MTDTATVTNSRPFSLVEVTALIHAALTLARQISMISCITIVIGGSTGDGLACANVLAALVHYVAIRVRRAGDTGLQSAVRREHGDGVRVTTLDVADCASVNR